MEEGRWVLLIASEVGGTDSVSDRAMERLVRPGLPRLGMDLSDRMC